MLLCKGLRRVSPLVCFPLPLLSLSGDCRALRLRKVQAYSALIRTCISTRNKAEPSKSSGRVSFVFLVHTHAVNISSDYSFSTTGRFLLLLGLGVCAHTSGSRPMHPPKPDRFWILSRSGSSPAGKPWIFGQTRIHVAAVVAWSSDGPPPWATLDASRGRALQRGGGARGAQHLSTTESCFRAPTPLRRYHS